MNYIIEDNFDFYNALKAEEPAESVAVCMISHEPLTYNAITLSCKHSFNYIPLYNELCLYNNKSLFNDLRFLFSIKNIELFQFFIKQIKNNCANILLR